MAIRNMLHKDKLEEFKQFLDESVITYRGGRGDWQVLQVKCPGLGWQTVYDHAKTWCEHYSCQDKMYNVLKQYFMWRKVQKQKRHLLQLSKPVPGKHVMMGVVRLTKFRKKNIKKGKVLSCFFCGPKQKCDDGEEHDMSGWEEFDGGGTCVCTKCGHRAIDDAYWSEF